MIRHAVQRAARALALNTATIGFPRQSREQIAGMTWAAAQWRGQQRISETSWANARLQSAARLVYQGGASAAAPSSASASCARGGALVSASGRVAMPRAQRKSYSTFGGTSYEALRPEKVLWGLIGANVSVYGLWQVADTSFMRRHFTVSESALLDLRLHTLVTSAFSQFDIWHLGGNMVSLYYFGGAVGSLFGGTALLQLYLVGGIVASVSHVAYSHFRREGLGLGGRRRSSSGSFPWGSDSSSRFRSFLPGDPPGLGASGAVNAVIVLNTLIWPTRIILVNFFIPVPAILFGGLALFRDVYMAHEGTSSNVGHAAHIGGAGVGLAAWALLRRRGRLW